MIIRYLLMVSAGMSLFCQSLSQSSTHLPLRLPETLVESIASRADETGDYDALLDELEFLQKNPLDLNRATREALEKLPFLTDFQITSLLEYRREKGKILSIYELQAVFGFTQEVIDAMLPFVMIRDEITTGSFSVRDIRKRSHHEVALLTHRTIEKSKGYRVYDVAARDMHYPGSPWSLNARYAYVSGDHIRAGLNLEKDPGEELFKSSNRNGFDFNSAYILIKNIGFIRSAVIGDYRLAFGQGLTLWNGTAPGKSTLPLNIIKRQDAIKPFTSNDENNFFRGMAVATSFGHFTLTAFFSSKERDGNITDTLESGIICFSSFQQSGYHRTTSEIADEKSVNETAFGANLLFRNNFLKVGSTIVSYKLDKYMEAGDDLKDIRDFSGNSLTNWGIDYAVTLKKIQLFGEASCGNNSWAMLHGALLNISKYASFSILYRNFSSGYFGLHTSAFSESSSDKNEEGFYTGIVVHPVAKLKISGYADFYHFPWLKYGISAPSSGSDYLLQVDYTPDKKVTMYLKLRYETDPQDELADSVILPEVVDIQHTGLRFHIRYGINDRIVIQNRIEMVISDPHATEDSKGFLVYQDMEYRLKKIPVVLDFRLAWFNTDSYASRIYAYEQDMLAGFSFSPLYDNGFRTYLMATWNLNKKLTCGIRFSNTCLFDKHSIGSGSDTIDSNSRNDLKIKLTCRL